jgi:hypothetical protein
MSYYGSCEEHGRDIVETGIWLEIGKENGEEFYNAFFVYVTILCLNYNAITLTIPVMAICELRAVVEEWKEQ